MSLPFQYGNGVMPLMLSFQAFMPSPVSLKTFGLNARTVVFVSPENQWLKTGFVRFN